MIAKEIHVIYEDEAGNIFFPEELDIFSEKEKRLLRPIVFSH